MAAQLEGAGLGSLGEEVRCAFAVAQEKLAAAHERLDLLEGLDRCVGEVSEARRGEAREEKRRE